MTNYSFQEKTIKHFKYLLDDYACTVIESTPETIVFQSNICQFLISLDRYSVQVLVGPTSNPKQWFDLRTVTAYVTKSSKSEDWDYELPRGVIASQVVEQQLERLAGILENHIRQIIPIFRKNIYSQIESELIEFGRKKTGNMWEQYL